MKDRSGDTPKDSRESGKVARALLSLVTLLLMLGLVELVLTFATPLPHSRRLQWLPDGHVKARLDPDQSPINASGNPVEINELGFRGPMPSWQPAPGTLRVVTLGDSSTFCYDVTDHDHTWPHRLETALEERLEMPVEVINLGLPGYDTSTSKVNYLFTGRALSPHVVTVYHTWNDLKFFRVLDRSEGTPRSILSGRASAKTNFPFLIRFFQHSQIVRRLTRIARIATENSYSTLEEEGEGAAAAPGDRSWAWFSQNYRDVATLASADGVLPVFVSQATLAHPENIETAEVREVVRNSIVGMTLPRLATTWIEANLVIERTAQQQGAVFIDGYSAVPADPEFVRDHVHLLDPGAELLARAIADGLVEDPRFQEVLSRVRLGAPAH